MRIETELRNAIKSAEKHQPSQMDWQKKKELVSKAIAELAASSRGKRITVITKRIKVLSDELSALRKELCRKFGVRESGVELAIADCGGVAGIKRFKAAGGKYPVEEKPNWTTDQVIAELVCAEPKAMDRILAKYGIVWK